MRYYVLNRNERKILRAIALLIIPNPHWDTKTFTRRMLYHIDRFLQQLSPILRFLFHVGALLFNSLPFIFMYNFEKFSSANLPAQRKWIDKISRSNLDPLYRWFTIVRGLILLVYYSQEEQHRKLRYFPQEWAKKKILQRRRLLNLTEEVPNDPYFPEYQTQSK